MKWSNKKFRKWIRIIHRDIGYLMVGISLIYGISGYILNHIDGTDPAFKSTEGTIVLAKYLSRAELATEWQKKDDLPEIKRILCIDDEHYRVMLDGGIGIYETVSGTVDYKYHKKKPIIYFMNKLHYNKVAHWTIVGDIFAFTLIFFALSGLFMVKGKKGISGNGKWYLITGLILPLVYILWM